MHYDWQLVHLFTHGIFFSIIPLVLNITRESLKVGLRLCLASRSCERLYVEVSQSVLCVCPAPGMVNIPDIW